MIMDNINKFSGKAEIYTKYRPKYPNAAIEYLIKKCNLSNNSKVVDIGCGTGILTKQLLDKNIDTIGIEPNIDMYNQAIELLKEYKVSIINSSAEDTTLLDNFADLVTVAQALHWFDLEKFILEYKRILKQNGRVAIIYNNANEESEAVSEFLDIHRELCPKYIGFSRGINSKKDIYTEMFGINNFLVNTYNNDQSLSFEEYMGYAKSLSYSLNPGESNYREYLFRLMEVFYKYCSSEKLIFPTTTTLVLSKQKRKL